MSEKCVPLVLIAVHVAKNNCLHQYVAAAVATDTTSIATAATSPPPLHILFFSSSFPPPHPFMCYDLCNVNSCVDTNCV